MPTRRLLNLMGCCLLVLSLAWSGCSNNSTTNSPSAGANSGADGGQVASADAASSSTAPPAAGAMPPNAVTPSEETIKSGTYVPLSRPLFIYVNKASLQKPAVVEYVRFYLSDEGQTLVPEVKSVPVNPAQLAETRQRFEQALQSAGATPPGEKIDGEVRINGSSTVAPISSAVSEAFNALQPKVRVAVGTAGTGGGFKDFVRGDIDICDASRPIQPTEIEACKAANIDYVELTIAIDGLTVVVNPANDWVAGMTVEQLKKVWEPDSKVTRWSDIDPSWPAESIKLFGPGTDSGTFEYFTEVIVGEKKKCRSDFQASENDNILVTGVAGEKYGLGYFGFAYFAENPGKLKALAIAP